MKTQKILNMTFQKTFFNEKKRLCTRTLTDKKQDTTINKAYSTGHVNQKVCVRIHQIHTSKNRVF